LKIFSAFDICTVSPSEKYTMAFFSMKSTTLDWFSEHACYLLTVTLHTYISYDMVWTAHTPATQYMLSAEIQLHTHLSSRLETLQVTHHSIWCNTV
jgi:hypothetical protein